MTEVTICLSCGCRAAGEAEWPGPQCLCRTQDLVRVDRDEVYSALRRAAARQVKALQERPVLLRDDKKCPWTDRGMYCYYRSGDHCSGDSIDSRDLCYL